MIRAVLLAALLAQATGFSVMNRFRVPDAPSARQHVEQHIESSKRPARDGLEIATMQENTGDRQFPQADWMRRTGRKTAVTLRSAAGSAAGELRDGLVDGLEGSVESSSQVLQQLGDILRRSNVDSGVVAAAAAAFAMLVLNPGLPGASMQALGAFWESYNGALAAGGLTTVAVKSATCSAVMGAGDVLCQKLFPKEEVIDGIDAYGRTVPVSKKSNGGVQLTGVFNFGLVGLLIAPIVHQWYGFLGSVSVGGLLGGVQQVCLDQLFFAPAMIALVFSMLQGLEGKGPAEMEAKLRNDWKTAVINNWKLWIPAQLINFIFVPAPLQVLFSNVVGLGWNVYLSKLNNKN